MVGVLLLEPLHFGFITQPTKRCLSLQFIPEAIAVEDVTEFFRALRSNLARYAASTSGSAICDLSCPFLDRIVSNLAAERRPGSPS